MLTELTKRIGTAHNLVLPESDGNGSYVPDILASGSGSGLVDLIKSKTWDLLDHTVMGLNKAPIDGDYQSFLECYAVVPWIYIANWVIASSISSLPLNIFEGSRNDAKQVDDGKIIDLFENPNVLDTFSSLIEFTVLNLGLTGNSYWEKRTIMDNLPLALFAVESANMRVVPDKKIKVAGYVYEYAGGKKDFKPEEIVHFKYSNPLNQFYGQGDIKVLQATIITELMRETYNKNFFENEARPDVILKQGADATKGIAALGKDDMLKTAKAWRQSFGGPKKGRLPVVLPAGMDIHLLTETIQDMHYREFEKSLRERVLGVAGIPPALVGLFEYASYANAKEQLKMFWTVTIPPKVRMLADMITKGILRPYNDKLWCQFDLSDIPALEEDPKDKSSRLIAELGGGVINRKTFREKMRYGADPKDKYAEEYVMLQQYIPVEDLFGGGDLTEETGETEET